MFLKKAQEEPELEKGVAPNIDENPETKKETTRAVEVREAYKSFMSAVKQLAYASFRINFTDDQLIELCNKLRAVLLTYITDTSEQRLKNILGDLVLTVEDKAKQEKKK